MEFLTRWRGNDSKSDFCECETRFAEGGPVPPAYKEVNIAVVPCRHLMAC